LAKRKQLMTRRDELIEERGRLLARQQDLEQALDALETYVRSAGFRLVEGMIRRLRHFPFAFKVARSTARKIVRR
jgi:hypothetical protein